MEHGSLLFVWAESVNGKARQRTRRDAIYLGEDGGRPLVFFQTESPQFPEGYALLGYGEALFMDTPADAAACATGRRAMKVVVNGREGFLLPGTEKVALRCGAHAWEVFQSLAEAWGSTGRPLDAPEAIAWV